MKIKIILTLIFAQLFMNIFSTTAFADVVDDERITKLKAELSEKLSKDPIVSCKENLFAIYDVELAEFLEFLDKNFQNKSANSSLTNIAISRYAKYKERLNEVFAQLVPGATIGGLNNLNSSELIAYNDCSKIKQSYLESGKKQMIDHVRNTNAQKKATMLLEKYQSINNGLRDLNLQIAKMYGFFKTFEAKLPFFIKNCITS